MDSAPFRLENIRQTLARLEQTVLFALIERAQFRHNERVYQAGQFPALPSGECLSGHLLRETERLHARIRRYTSPDEHPFYPDLPIPILPPLAFPDNPLHPNAVNFNAQIFRDYVARVIPSLCAPGDDQQYGSSAVCDVQCLQVISRRVHYGKFVAESKYREKPALLETCCRHPDDDALLTALTHPAVERDVLARVRDKARAFLTAITKSDPPPPDPEAFVSLYRDWLIPLNKAVQAAYLRRRINQTSPTPVPAG